MLTTIITGGTIANIAVAIIVYASENSAYMPVAEKNVYAVISVNASPSISKA